MRKIVSFIVALFLLTTMKAQENSIAKNPIVITGKLIRITKPLREFTLADNLPFVKVRDENGIIG